MIFGGYVLKQATLRQNRSDGSAVQREQSGLSLLQMFFDDLEISYKATSNSLSKRKRKEKYNNGQTILFRKYLLPNILLSNFLMNDVMKEKLSQH